MEKTKALRLLEQVSGVLNEILQRGATTADEDRAIQLVEAAVTNVFGADSEHLETLDRINRGMPSSSVVGKALSILMTARDEVNIFWEGDEDVKPAETSRPKTQHDPALVFVIHGRQKRSDMHDFLRAIGLKPFEWSQARKYLPNPNPYTWEIVDMALSKAGAIVALMTPDDEARLREELWTPGENAVEKVLLGQPRQNVLFEAGVAYGRNPRRTVLVRLGSHRPMSDLAGHHILSLDNSPESRQAIADALRTAGCAVDLSGSDWFRAGNFG